MGEAEAEAAVRRLEAMVMSKEESLIPSPGPRYLYHFEARIPSHRRGVLASSGEAGPQILGCGGKGRRHPAPFPVDSLVSLICRPYCIETASRPASPPSAYPLEPRNQLFSWRLLLVIVVAGRQRPVGWSKRSIFCHVSLHGRSQQICG